LSTRPEGTRAAPPKSWGSRAKLLFRGKGLASVLARGASTGFAVSVAGTGLGLLLQLLLARLMGAEQYGYVAYVLTWVNSLMLLAHLGLTAAVTRFVPAYASQEAWGLLRGLLRRTSLLVLGASVLVGSATLTTTAILSDALGPDLLLTFWIGGLLLPVMAFLGLAQSTLRALKRPGLAQTPLLVGRPLFLSILALAVVYGLQLDSDGPTVMGRNLVACATLLVVALIWVRRHLPIAARSAPPEYSTREWLRMSLPLLFVNEMQVLLNSLDVILIGALVGTTEAGIYAVAVRMSQLTRFGLTAAKVITAPVASELFTQARMRSLQKAVTGASWMASLSSFALGLAVVAGAPWVLPWFGEEFGTGTHVVWILVCGQLVNALTGPVGSLLNVTGYHDASARIAFTTAVINLAVNYPVILTYGPTGAAVVTSLSIALKNLWTWWVVRKRLGINSSILPLRRHL